MSLLQIVGAAVLCAVLFRFVALVVRLFLSPATKWARYGAKTGAWALVTGSTDGIGREFALQLAQKGLNVILVARNGEKLRATQQLIEKEANAAAKEKERVLVEVREFDFSQDSPAGMEALVASLQDKQISVLVNNVGVSHAHPEYFAETTSATLRTLVNVNVLNTIELTRAVLPQMTARKAGLVLNVGSFSGETPIPLLQTYSATKAFLKVWSMGVAAEVAAQNVQVQLLNTYFVVSNMSKRKRPSLLIPTPRDYVAAALKNAGQSDFATPYPAHALLNELMSLAPTALLTKLNLSQMRAVRQLALQKAKRT